MKDRSRVAVPPEEPRGKTAQPPRENARAPAVSTRAAYEDVGGAARRE